MSDAHGVARDQLRAFVERIERLEEEKKTIADDIKDVYGEAKSMGFDTKILKKAIAILEREEQEVREEILILDTYLHALGMIESPIVIRAYLDKLTRSELFLMMVVGLATVAGSTMVAYAAILADLAASGWGRLDLILNTHWHPDHTQGNARLKAETGCEIVGPEEVRRAAPLDRVVAGGDVVELGATRIEVTEAPGHTLGHVVYRSQADQAAFVGDVLFALGCGRLFEGSPDQMWTSLSRIASSVGALATGP